MGKVWLAERVSEAGASKLVALKVVPCPRLEGVSIRARLDLEYVEGVDLSKIAGMLRSEGQPLSEAAIGPPRM